MQTSGIRLTILDQLEVKMYFEIILSQILQMLRIVTQDNNNQ